MTSSDHFKCECQHCQGHLECPAEAAGQTIECPHCGKTTELSAATRPTPVSGAAKKLLFAGIVLVALILAGMVWANRHAKQTERLRQEAEAAARLAARQTAEAEARARDPLAREGWGISAILLEKKPGSTIIYAVGTLTNETDRRRFGVKLQLDLFDAAEQKIGGAKDYQAAIEPRGRWQFSALVVDARAVTAKVAAIEESP